MAGRGQLDREDKLLPDTLTDTPRLNFGKVVLDGTAFLFSPAATPKTDLQLGRTAQRRQRAKVSEPRTLTQRRRTIHVKRSYYYTRCTSMMSTAFWALMIGLVLVKSNF